MILESTANSLALQGLQGRSLPGRLGGLLCVADVVVQQIALLWQGIASGKRMNMSFATALCFVDCARRACEKRAVGG